MKDTTQNADYYFEFYEEVGRKLPETAIVHGHRGLNSRYWTVWRELRPLANRGAMLLDVGCNDGVYTVPFCQNGGRALGIDISPTLIQRATENASASGVPCRFIQADIEAIDLTSFVGEPIDVVLFSEVIEHLADPDQALRNIAKPLSPGGQIILTAPTPLSEAIAPLTPKYLYRSVWGRKLLERHLLDTTQDPVLQRCGVAPYLWRHDGYYPKALRRYVEGFGFRCERFYTIGLVHYTVKKIIRSLFGEQAFAQLSDPLPIPSADHRVVMTPPVRHRLWSTLRSTYHVASQVGELCQRQVPVMKLIGTTNVGVFRKLA